MCKGAGCDGDGKEQRCLKPKAKTCRREVTIAYLPEVSITPYRGSAMMLARMINQWSISCGVMHVGESFLYSQSDKNRSPNTAKGRNAFRPP